MSLKSSREEEEDMYRVPGTGYFKIPVHMYECLLPDQDANFRGNFEISVSVANLS